MSQVPAVCHDAVVIANVPPPPVVPPGRLARSAQPVLGLPGGLVLRPWRPADAQTLVVASRDPAIRLWNLLVVESAADARRRIERMHERWRAEQSAIWAIAHADGADRPAGPGAPDAPDAPGAPDGRQGPPGEVAPAPGEAIGLIGWRDLDLAGGSAEIVYWLLPPARGGGVAVEAVRRLSRWALDDLGLHRLRLCHAVANPASCRVAAKAGYALEGTMRSALLHADGWHDQHLHALVQGDLPAVQGDPLTTR